VSASPAGGPPVEALVDPRTEVARARRETLGQFATSKTLLVGVVIVGFWIVCALFGSAIAPHDPLAFVGPTNAGPRSQWWFGTDQLGRDVLSRVIVGARDILVIAPLATLLGITLGTLLGLITGYFQGWVDDALSRVIDAVLALPLIIIAVTVLTSLGTTSGTTVVVVIGIIFTPLVARTVRSAVLGERQLDYVQAARLRGERAPYVLGAEILPNVTAPILVEGTVRLGYAIFTVAALTFLGLGVQPPSPDWALQVKDNYQLLDPYWWETLFPSLAIASLVVGVNLIADGIATVLDQ
jgi:peptide/nickel transport system permease protein